jgi:hypothetical protein
VLFICRELREISHSSLGTQPSQAPYIGWLAPVAHQVRLASCPSDEYAQIPPGNLPKVQSGKYENRFILVGNLKTFEVSGHFTGKYFNFEAFCGKSASAITDFPLIGHQCSHKDNNSADHRPQIVIAIYKWQISHHRSWCHTVREIPLASSRTPEHSLLTSLVIGVSSQPFRTDIQPPPSFEVSWRHRIFASSNACHHDQLITFY